jgi:hypothetical protein
VAAETAKQKDEEQETQRKQAQAGRIRRGKAQQGEQVAEKVRSTDTREGSIGEKEK